jgi:ribonuclease R
MIIAEEIISFMKETVYKPMTYQELEKHFDIQSAIEFKELLLLLNALEEQGEILKTRNDRYGIPERMDLIKGRLQVNAKGFGFLIPEDREHPDVYIAAHDMSSAMNGDTVFVRITMKSHSGGKLEGEIVRVIYRAHKTLVGTFQLQESFGFVIPDDKRIVRDIFVTKEQFSGAMDGQKVVIEIVAYPEGRSAAQGKVIEILGHKDDPGVDILSIIRKFQLPEMFPDEVMHEAELIPDQISAEDWKGRRDFRDKTIITIDGEDAKDLDDAVHVERLANGNYVLGVHIADVGYYVKEDSQLDQVAYQRGCSVYLVDRVIPMLPHRLSNGICSLNPQVERLTLSCEMEFDRDATLVRHDICASVIKTKERMTYTHVRQLLQDEDEHPELRERYEYLMDDFHLMKELAMRLRWKRMNRGAIDFDFVESKILVNSSGKPTEIVKRERSIAEMIIEEFMLAANETVAEHFHWLKVPFLYRIHENPDAEKLMHLMEFITNFGYMVKGKGNTIHPRALQTLLEEIKDKPEAVLISKVMLRSMKQAKYDSQSLGHFGLAAEFYSHFTSPIRRYPDLVIHRIIREVIDHGQMSESRLEFLASRMDDIARQSSERERVAVEAERETDALKKAEFMLDKIGMEFEGMISSVTSFGIFVELLNTVEGLIRLSDLTDDYYHYHDKQHALIGERTSKVYRIGDIVKVKVARVSVNERTIDFEMVDMKPRGNVMNFVRGNRMGKRGANKAGRGIALRGNISSDKRGSRSSEGVSLEQKKESRTEGKTNRPGKFKKKKKFIDSMKDRYALKGTSGDKGNLVNKENPENKRNLVNKGNSVVMENQGSKKNLGNKKNTVSKENKTSKGTASTQENKAGIELGVSKSRKRRK